MATFLPVLVLILLLAFVPLIPQEQVRRPFQGERARGQPDCAPSTRRLNTPKPAWERQEIIRRKALIPETSCRKLAAGFNAEFAHRRNMTVGHSWVAVTVKRSAEQIRERRRAIRSRKNGPGPRNRVWGLDLTQVSTDAGPVHVLGAVDHGTRACLGLQALGTKATIQILRVLFDFVERFGRPAFVRTDNEAVFTSRRFRWVLIVLGLRHQLTQVASPWQNGRVERFFETLKGKWAQRAHLPSTWIDWVAELRELRIWYNHLRPHQHLEGITPARAWDGQRRRPFSESSEYVEAWDGVLSGFYSPP